MLRLPETVFFALICTQAAYAGQDFLQTNSVVEAKLLQKEDNKASVILTMQDGWHIYSNPASMEFLIPTDVKMADSKEGILSVAYPAPTQLETPLGKVSVYSKEVEIPFEVKDATKESKVSVTAQACDEGTCYPPSTWIFRLSSLERK